jgi:hypothetical protein
MANGNQDRENIRVGQQQLGPGKHQSRIRDGPLDQSRKIYQQTEKCDWTRQSEN